MDVQLYEQVLSGAATQALPLEVANTLPAGEPRSQRLDRAITLGAELAAWSLCARMAVVFSVYGDLIEEIEPAIDHSPDPDGHGYVIEGSLFINNEHYAPGDANEFNVELMEAMEDIDGLVALNALHDLVANAIPKSVQDRSDDIINAAGGPCVDMDEALARAERASPTLHPILEGMVMELKTRPAPGAGRQVRL